MKTYRLEEAEMVECVLGEWVRLEDVIVKPDATTLPEAFRRVALLFTKRCTRTKFAKGEQKAWEGAKDRIKEHDMELLEWFYDQPKGTEYDQTWHKVKTPATLLNNLDAQLDFAYALKEGMRKAKENDPFAQFTT